MPFLGLRVSGFKVQGWGLDLGFRVSCIAGPQTPRPNLGALAGGFGVEG